MSPVTTPHGYMAAEEAPGGQRYLTGNVTPGWEITRFPSSAKIFSSAEEAASAAESMNRLGHKFEAIPAQVLATGGAA